MGHRLDFLLWETIPGGIINLVFHIIIPLENSFDRDRFAGLGIHHISFHCDLQVLEPSQPQYFSAPPRLGPTFIAGSRIVANCYFAGPSSCSKPLETGGRVAMLALSGTNPRNRCADQAATLQAGSSRAGLR